MNATHFDLKKVEDHYSREDIGGAILDALVAKKGGTTSLRLEDLSPIDEFHIGGRRATLELARKIDLDSEMRVLDVGCGLGGAGRHLAKEFGCRVTGLDLSSKYCRIAGMLTRMLRLDHLVSYHHGNALEMPFEDAAFDVVWTQHTAMNIPDKEKLYAEMRRVLKPGGILALYDILAGDGGAAHFPVPWARGPAISFLMTARQLQSTLEMSGFEILEFEDKTEAGRSWFRRMAENLETRELPPLGIHLLLGSDYRRAMKNQLRNLEEDRIALVEAVVRVPEQIGRA